MFENMIDPLIERCRPHALTIRDECRMFAESVIERLDRIEQAAADDDNTEYIRRVVYVSVGIAVTQIASVPPNEEWELETWSASGVSQIAGTVEIFDSPEKNASYAPLSFITLNNTGIGMVGGNGVRVQGGTDIYSQTSDPARLRLQWRCKRREVGRRANLAAGFRNPAPDRTDGLQEVEDTRRHVGSWHPGMPVMGPSAH